MSLSPAWSDERVATLKSLWLDGLSASQIAGRLGGVTRNTVIGKAHRLGLGGRAAPANPARAPRLRAARPARRTCPARPQRPAAPAVATSAASTAPEGPGLVDDLARLPAHACKWPIGDPKDAGFSFCGRAADGRYCATHEAAGVRPGAAWRADRDPTVRRALAGLI